MRRLPSTGSFQPRLLWASALTVQCLETLCILSQAASLQDAGLPARAIPPRVPEGMRAVTGVALPHPTWRVAHTISHVHPPHSKMATLHPISHPRDRDKLCLTGDLEVDSAMVDELRSTGEFEMMTMGVDEVIFRKCSAALAHAVHGICVLDDTPLSSRGTRTLPEDGIVGRRSTAWSCTCRSSPTPSKAARPSSCQS